MSAFPYAVHGKNQPSEMSAGVSETAAIVNSEASNLEDFTREDAAKYRLLRRLAPTLRHDLLGAHQVPEFMIGMIEKRLRYPSPDLDAVREDLTLLRNASEKAAGSSVKVIGWIEPDEEQTSDVDTAVFDCVAMLSLPLKLKGFNLVNDVAGIDAKLFVTAVRVVLSATLIAFGDHSKAPATLLVQAQAIPGFVEISVSLCPADKTPTFFGARAGRPLEWHEVEVLARGQSVHLALSPFSAHLTFSRAA